MSINTSEVKIIEPKINDRFNYGTIEDALKEMEELKKIGIDTELTTYSNHGFIAASLTVTNIRKDEN